ncbi:BTAD domain-containing putative transcriptional regulator [Pseudarthrobacter oxydans]|uniref:BTAD domain-containing putative transcriptional regulator n=1 Tax=Pseudarthrobacter oxydans TaxID=1671 RepID=UPI00293775C2|nr:BTAD domain-containing putative transcriptional regulator [Actinomycetes bacterium ARC8]
MKQDIRPQAEPVRTDPAGALPQTWPAAPNLVHTELRLTGPVCLMVAGHEPVRLASAQAQAAVARLVLDRLGNGTPREQLADVIWPEGLPDTWASAMRSVVSRIRRFLAASGVAGADLTSHGGRYYLLLPAGIVVDVEEAEKQLAKAAAVVTEEADALCALREAENAVRCLRRPFLANREGDWAAHMRMHLADRANHGLEVASQAALSANEIGAAISHSAELISRAPLRESAYRNLMSAYQEAGNRGDALATYSSLRSHLRDELGVDPSPETQQLYYEILGPGPGTAGAPLKQARRRRHFVGRGPALEALDRAHRASQRGSVQMILLTGELGIGKSRVLHEFGRQLNHTEEVVVPVQCQAYPPTRPAIASSLAEVAALAAEGSVFARVQRRLEKVASDCNWDASGPGAGAAVGSLVELILEVAARLPTTLILDDLDTADGITQAVVRRLVFHTGPAVRLTLAAASTSSRSAANFLRHAHELPHPNAFQAIELAPFTPYEVHEFVSAVPDDGKVRRPGIGELMDRSGGNPFLLSALMAAGAGQGTGNDAVSLPVLDYVHTRTAGLDPDAATLLAYASASGEAIDFDVVSKAAGRTGITAGTIGSLVRAGLLMESPSSGHAGPHGHFHHFRHGLVREAIYAGLGTAERFEIHSRLFSTLRELQRHTPARAVPELARQLLAKQSLGKQLLDHDGPSLRLSDSVEACREAAAAAVGRGRVSDAVRLYLQTLELAPPQHVELRARTLAELGRLEAAHALPGAIDHLRDGALLALQCRSITVALDAASDLIEQFDGVPHFQGETTALTDLVLQEVAGLPADRPAAEEEGAALGRFMARSYAVATSRPAPALAERAMDALHRQLANFAPPTHGAQRARTAEDLWQLASAAGHPDLAVEAARNRAAAAAIQGDARALAEWSARLEETVKRHDHPERFRHLLDAVVLMTQVSSGWALWKCTGPHLKGSGAQRQLLVARWIRSVFGPHPQHPQPLAVETDRGLTHPGYRADQCLQDVLDGQLGTARLRLRGLLLEPTLPPGNDAEFHSLAVMATAAAELGDVTAAQQLYGLLSPLRHLMACHGIQSFAGPASYHLARLARITHHVDEAEELVTASINQASAISARPWVALAQRELAVILQSRGRPGDARLIEALLAEATRLVHGYAGPAEGRDVPLTAPG